VSRDRAIRVLKIFKLKGALGEVIEKIEKGQSPVELHHLDVDPSEL
jgi:hypothetical protein